MNARPLPILGIALASLSMALDARADVYVAEPGFSNGQPAILVFASDASADEPPVRIIAGSNTELTDPFSVTVDPVNEEIYVSNFPISGGQGKILVFPLDADGNIAPQRSLIDGPSSQLKWPRKVAVDTVNDEIVVASFNLFGEPFSSIRVYPRTADGDIAPLRSIFGENTRLDNPIDLVVDPKHDEIITNSYNADGNFTPGIVVFSRTADGDVAPLRTIVGPSTQLGAYTNLLAYDPVHDELYADASGGSAYAVFPRAASGDVAPTRRVTGFTIGGDGGVHAIEYDSVHERVLIADFEDDNPDFPISVQSFPRDADGQVPPVFTLSGQQTTLTTPSGLSTDADGGFSGFGARIYVAEGPFDGEVDQDALTLETFESGATQPEEVEICSEPLSSASNDACFAPGQLVDGFAVTSSSGNALATLGSGYFGNDSTVVGAVFSGDATVVHFNPPRTILALDALLFSGEESGFVGIALYDVDGTALGSTRMPASSFGTPAFLGVISPTPVARAELTAGNGTVMMDDLRLNPEDVNFATAGLAVDAQAGISDSNGVLEPGEQVVVAPSWRNLDSVAQSLTGTASNLAGPPGATYTLVHDAADYGTLDPMTTASCADLGLCYQVSIDDPPVRPATRWEVTFDETLSDGMVRTWTLPIGGSFSDVPPASPFYRAVETLLTNGVASGCGGAAYCPGTPSTRAQMPVFVLRALEGPDYVPPVCEPGSGGFDDVPSDSPFCPWITELVERGVLAGCSADSYCPQATVTRAQTAIFLLKTLEGPDYNPPACEDLFTDVPCTSLFADWIEELFRRGITGGCRSDPLAYCPDAPVSRQQMAVIVSRTFGLTLYGP